MSSLSSEMTTESSESELLLPPQAVPRDRWKLVYVVFYLLGIGTLLPWNFFSNAKQYFMYKLRNVSDSDMGNYYDPSDQTELQVMFESYLSVAAMLPNVLFMFINTAATKLISLRVRMVLAAIVMIIMFGLTVALVKINTDNWQVRFFAVTLVSIIIMNAGSAILQGGIFGLSSMFPSMYTQSVMGGMGMGGTLAAVANLLAIFLSSNPLDMGFGYFLTADVVIFIALIGYLVLPLLKYARYHTAVNEQRRRRSTFINDRDGEREVLISDEHKNECSSEPPEIAFIDDRMPLWPVFKKIWPYGFSVCFTFMVTLCCYPSVNSAIYSMHHNQRTSWTEKYFMPVTCFLFFNVGDLFGRTLAGWIQKPQDGSRWLLVFTLVRVVLVPMFMLCNVQPRNNLPVVFNSDVYPMIFMWIFALSNGYLGTLFMMYGPRRVPSEDVEMAGSMMSFFLALGLALGSVLSFAIVKFINLV